MAKESQMLYSHLESGCKHRCMDQMDVSLKKRGFSVKMKVGLDDESRGRRNFHGIENYQNQSLKCWQSRKPNHLDEGCCEKKSYTTNSDHEDCRRIFVMMCVVSSFRHFKAHAREWLCVLRVTEQQGSYREMRDEATHYIGDAGDPILQRLS